MGVDAASVLNELDANWRLMLDHPYERLVDVRLSAFASEVLHDMWALVVEVLAYNDRGMGHDMLSVSVHRFGPATEYDGDQFARYYPTSDADSCALYDQSNNSIANDATTFLVRGVEVPVPPKVPSRKHFGFTFDELDPLAMFRNVTPQYRDLFFLTDKELQQITLCLPLVLRLNEWRHMQDEDETRPSEVEAFQQIAEVIATRAPSRYQPTLPPNTHWSQRTDDKL